jgi:hypothetical protein
MRPVLCVRARLVVKWQRAMYAGLRALAGLCVLRGAFALACMRRASRGRIPGWPAKAPRSSHNGRRHTTTHAPAHRLPHAPVRPPPFQPASQLLSPAPFCLRLACRSLGPVDVRGQCFLLRQMRTACCACCLASRWWGGAWVTEVASGVVGWLYGCAQQLAGSACRSFALVCAVERCSPGRRH